MKKMYKHYIEKFYPVKNSATDEHFSEIEETSCTDPLLVEQGRTLTGFRFFDVDARKKENFVAGDIVNCSPMYYFGQRITLDIDSDFSCVALMKNYLQTYGLESAIFCKNGKIIKDIPDGAMTIEELKEVAKKEFGEKYIFDEGEFFKGLACCLSHAGSDVVYMENDSYWPLTDEVDLGTDEEVVVRTYSIYEDGYELVSKSSILPVDRLGVRNVSTYINLNQVMDLVEPLYLEHPYLNDIMSNVRVEVFASGTEGIENKMIDAAIEELDSKDVSEERLVYEKTRKNDN